MEYTVRSGIRSRLKPAAGVLFYRLGLFRLLLLLRRARGGSLTIVTYHRISTARPEEIDDALPYLFVTRDAFERQLRFYKAHYRIVDWRTARGDLGRNLAPGENHLLITFDDGYEDNYRHGLPILDKHGLQAVVFVPPGDIDRGNGLGYWWDRTYFLLKRRERAGRDPGELEGTAGQACRRFRSDPIGLFSALNDWPEEGVARLIRELEESLGDASAPPLPENNRLATWDQLREMGRRFTVESHGLRHGNLTLLAPEEVERESRESRHLLLARLGERATAIAYPAGKYDDRVVDACERAGFRCGMTTDYGVNPLRQGGALRRINVWEGSGIDSRGNFSEEAFSITLSGLVRGRRQPPGGRWKKEGDRPGILFIIDNFIGFGGTERHLHELIRNLQDRYTCHVLAFNIAPEIAGMLREQGIPVFAFTPRKYYSPAILGDILSIRRIIRSRGIRIVQTYHFKSDLVGVVAAKVSGVRCIVSSRRDMGFMKSRLNRTFLRFSNLLVDRFLAVSKAVASAAHRDESIPRAKFDVIYNGIDVKKFDYPNDSTNREMRARLGIPLGDFVVVLVGHMRPEKNYEMILKAATILHGSHDDFRVVIVGGDGDGLKQGYERFCREHGILDHVVFPGYTGDPRSYTCMADVCCLVSRTEGFSNAILEYMALGKAVVATDVGGNGEIVREGVHGSLIPDDDHEALARSLDRYYRDREETRRIGAANRECIVKDFTIDRMASAHCDLYGRLLEARGE